MKRDATGKFTTPLGEEPKREVNLSLTQTAWTILEQQAQQQGISKSELIEHYARGLQPPAVTPNEELLHIAPPAQLQPAPAAQEPLPASIDPPAALDTWIAGNTTTALQADTRERATHRKLINILSRITDAFVAFDHHWRYIYVNEAASRLLQQSQQALLGKTLWEMFPDLEGTEIEARLKQAMQQHIAVQYEQFYLPLNLWVEVHAYPSVDGLSLYFRDISDRKQADQERSQMLAELSLSEQALRDSEERFRAMFDQAAVGINQIDLDRRFLLVNPAYCKITGYSQEELLQMTWQDVTHPDDMAIELVQSQRLLSGEANGFSLEKRYIHKTGAIVWVNVTSSAVRDSAGRPKYTIGIIKDITDRVRVEDERKQAEQEREQLLERERIARARAEAANRIKTEFLAVLSHELRSPLNPILGWTKLLRTRSFDKPAMDRALEVVERNAKLQAQLIEDLLDVSRILQGKMVLNVTAVDLATVVDAALETVRLAAEAKSIQISTQFAANVGRVNGDANRLQQVVWNVLSNAIKFTPISGRVEVQLERVEGAVLSSSPAPSSYAQITIRDTGKGIHPSFLPHAFDYFRQEDGTITRRFGGLGLGLAIVRHLTELHGGTVQAESAGEGQGATFTIKLPLLKDEGGGMKDEPSDSSLLTRRSVGLSADDEALPLAGIRVLLVDDDPDMRELAIAILQPQGAELCVVASAAEALSVLSSFQPDVLVSDIGMPEMDGYMLMRQVRQRTSEPGKQTLEGDRRGPVGIALMAYAGEFNQQQFQKAGFRQHVTKPVEPSQLIEVIRMAAESSAC